MKKLFILMMVVGASFAVNSAYSQVHVSVNFEKDYPGASYYNYPKWNGHYKDKAYYDHYHARFEKENHAYFHGRTFDHDRFDHDHHRH